MKPGRYDDMPEDDYHADLDALNNSAISQLVKSIDHYLAWRDGDHSPTKAMLLGSAVHCAVLEPGRYDDYVACCGTKSRRTKAYKQLAEEHDGLAITQPMQDDAQRMAEAVRSHPIASEWLDPDAGDAEVTYYWDGPHGVRCRARVDYVGDDGDYIVDLKTSRDPMPDGFERSIAKYGYHRQAAHYREGFERIEGFPRGLHIDERPEFRFVVVESSEPHGVRCYRMSPHAIEVGRRERLEAIRTLVDYREQPDDTWTGLPLEVEEIGLPRWY